MDRGIVDVLLSGLLGTEKNETTTTETWKGMTVMTEYTESAGTNSIPPATTQLPQQSEQENFVTAAVSAVVEAVTTAATNVTERLGPFNGSVVSGGSNYGGPVNIWEGSWTDSSGPGNEEFPLPLYIRVTAFVFLVVIFAVGTLGNTMVIIVINCSRDMRTSTNIFLVNLSIADLLVLLICTPTCIMEVYYEPEIWYLGEAMCKLVPLLEMTVAHASVLTILAISFERYYAICCPLRANYVCTKARAATMCLSAWLAAGIITSPVYFMTSYYEDPPSVGHCNVMAGSFWPDFYTVSSIVLFFLLPLVILIVMYRLIAKNLTSDSCRLSRTYTRQNHRARRQVIMMLGTVVFAFFLCLLPFRVLTLYVLVADHNPFSTNLELYYNLLYFCRIMLYINSALNPILYNIMSSKFRNGFLNLCSRKRRKLSRLQRRGTLNTMITTSSVSTTSNIPNNFIHSVAATPTISSERRRQGGGGLSLYGQCCRCQSHDYVTHVWLESGILDLNNENKCRRKRGFRRHNTPGGSINESSSNGGNAHWYCRKCREHLQAKWESKYLFYGATATAATASSSSSSSSPTTTTTALLLRNTNSPTLNTYNNSYPPTIGYQSQLHYYNHRHQQHHNGQQGGLRLGLLGRCCILSCQVCRPSPPMERYAFQPTPTRAEFGSV